MTSINPTPILSSDIPAGVTDPVAALMVAAACEDRGDIDTAVHVEFLFLQASAFGWPYLVTTPAAGHA